MGGSSQMDRNHGHHTYGFKLKGEHQERIAGLHVIGKEYRAKESYEWNGLKRSENGRIVFQYTLGGRGAIRIGEETYDLEKEQAFLVQLPSDHCYYLPDGSSHWEFIFITLYGQEAMRYFNELTEQHGHILRLPIHAKPIKHIFRLLEKIETTGIHDAFEASGYAYSFLMECMQYFSRDQKQADALPLAIAKSMRFMEENYARDLTLVDIVAISGLSKYHFTRLFHKTVKVTPIQYLTKVRMNQAIELLQNKELTIEDIARAVGYANGNYFTKVFKNVLDVTPSAYRNSESFMPVDRLFFD